ncbi:MAG: chromosomal replication initiator protein DnaA [Deltaproteobacteria bacterium]|jgi:chromosomal replication initiator protein|nr:MAG: chromosomal replication initiator protein DnaA [Deltaproteobacteria bacterium]
MDIWQGALEKIEKNIDPRTFENWFLPIKLVSIEQETIEIEVPNKFFKDWFYENYLPLIKEAISTFSDKQYAFKFSYSKQKKGARPTHNNKSIATKVSPPLCSSSIGDSLNQNYSFENFVVGNSNQFAHAASLAVATNPAKAYNPLFIYGGVGLGKTHLLNAIGNFITNKSIQICYVSSENFMNELINSIRYDKMVTFREKFRGIEVLLIDDIQFIAGKERTQEEFFHTFNSLYESQKQIVVTSDKFPKEIPSLEERLRSRFEWGLIADIQPPETETKIAILKNKAYSNNIPLPDDVAFFLAENIKTNIRELEGSLIRIGAFASLTESEINLNIAKEVLKEIISNKNKEVNIDAIQKAVAYFFKIKVSDLTSNKKLKIFTLPRQVAMYLSRKLTSLSFPEIGVSFGGKDHSTVIYAVNKIDKQIESDNSIKEAVNYIKSKLE